MSSIESYAVLANMLIVGGVGGYFIGYALKRIAKMLIIGLGILTFSVASLAFIGTINVNYDGIANGVTNLLNPEEASMILQAITNCIPLIAGFALGFLLGIGKK